MANERLEIVIGAPYVIIRIFRPMKNETPAGIGQGCGTDYVRIDFMSAPPSSEAGGERSAAGDLACRVMRLTVA